MKSFKQKALEILEAEPSVSNEVLSDLMDDEIDFWHEHENVNESLKEFLGFTEAEYEASNRTSDVREILDLK